jgi:probable F420-dependent oxidoreductase
VAKVRIGFGLGTGAFDATAFADLVDGLEALGFDSLWMSERVTGPSLDPLMALAVAAGRTRRLKLGTSVLLLPRRTPLHLAKELATLDRLSGGRALPAFGLGTAQGAEHQAFGVLREERAAIFDEALPLIRRLWTEEEVTHHGDRFHLDGVNLQPKPVQSPPDVWLGGRAPSELRRVGRLGDGWLPSFSTPAEAEAGRAQVEAAAARAGRTIDPEHWGALVLYSQGSLPEALVSLLATRRPGLDPSEVVAEGPESLRRRLQDWVDHGFSKLVVVPVGGSSAAIVSGLPALADAVLEMQTSKRAA